MKRNKMIWLGLGAAAVALLALASDRERKIVRVVKTWNPDYDILQLGSTPAFSTVFYSDGTEDRIAANQRNYELEAEVEKWIAEGGVIEEAGSPSVSGIGGAETDLSFDEFVRLSMEDKDFNGIFEVNINDFQKKKVLKIAGGNIDRFIISANRIRHSYKGHKKEGVDFNALRLIPFVLDNGIVEPEIDTSRINEVALKFSLRMNGNENITIMTSFVTNKERRYEMKTFFVNKA